MARRKESETTTSTNNDDTESNPNDDMEDEPIFDDPEGYVDDVEEEGTHAGHMAFSMAFITFPMSFIICSILTYSVFIIFRPYG